MKIHKNQQLKHLEGKQLGETMWKNNQGFSLVELIVVILIMAIVAVALAPQVMKWVENSRIASDMQMKADLENACKLAIADEGSFDLVKNGGYEIILTKDDDGMHYSYKTKKADGTEALYTNGSRPPMDAFWKNFFKVGAHMDFEDFEDTTYIRCTSTDGSNIEMKIHVYEGGFTFSELKGYTSDVFES